ncbi:MAG: three-Cys-motif partner protein TcmP [Candidatus Micropelagos sp.]|nr:three-Cys-motif partner protein TcmP [Candidatus Micropelagos sp.]
MKNLRTFFNDRDEQAIGFLESAIKQIPGIGTLKFEPKISCEEIGENYLEMKDTNIIPSFSFLDPWGYKGLSLGLIEAFIKDWGCDCFFFFNYNRISMGLGNDKVTHHIDALFGEVRAKEVRRKLTEGRFTSEQRANIILENVIGALEDKAGNQKRYVLPFCFKNDSGSRISHYLIFVSKHFKGYDTMKTIMHRASTANTDEAYFSYCPADEVSPLLFGLFKPLESLKNRLTRTYSGQSYYLNKLYEKDSYKTPFIKKNYKDACLELEKEELVEIQRPKPTSPKNSVADNSQIRFV